MECYIFREQELIRTFKTKYIPNKKRNPLIYIPTVIFALIIEIFNFPLFYHVFSIGFAVLLHFMINGSGKTVIEEESNTTA